jgi:hypothetical protein
MDDFLSWLWLWCTDPAWLWLWFTDPGAMLSAHWPNVLLLIQLIFSLSFVYNYWNHDSDLALRVIARSTSMDSWGMSFVFGMCHCFCPTLLWFFNKCNSTSLFGCWLLSSTFIRARTGLFHAHLEYVRLEIRVYAKVLQIFWFWDRNEAARKEKVKVIMFNELNNRSPQEVHWVDYLELLRLYDGCFCDSKKLDGEIVKNMNGTGSTLYTMADLIEKKETCETMQLTAHTFPFVWRSALFGRVSFTLLGLLAWLAWQCVLDSWLYPKPSEADTRRHNAAFVKEHHAKYAWLK